MKIEKKSWLLITTVSAIGVLILLAFIWFWQPLSAWFVEAFHPENLEEHLERFGPWAPLIFILLQAAQVIIAPIPMQVLGLVGGYMFGTWLGTLYALIGLTIGTTIAVWLARTFGRRLVERFIDPGTLKRFDHLIERGGLLIFFLIFLFPGLPDDAICFIAGLTALPIRSVVLVSFLGRLPGLWYMSLVGDSFRSGSLDWYLLIILTSVVILLAVMFIYRERIEAFVLKLVKQREMPVNKRKKNDTDDASV